MATSPKVIDTVTGVVSVDSSINTLNSERN